MLFFVIAFVEVLTFSLGIIDEIILKVLIASISMAVVEAFAIINYNRSILLGYHKQMMVVIPTAE